MNVEQLEKEIKRLKDQPEACFDSNKWMVESHRTLALAQLEVALHTARLVEENARIASALESLLDIYESQPSTRPSRRRS